MPDKAEEKSKVKFTVDYFKTNGEYGKYEVVKELAPQTSIRKVALAILQDLKSKDQTVYLDNPPESTSLSIYLANEDIKNIVDGWNATHEFGLNYVLLSDGSLRVLNMYEPLKHDWTLQEVAILVQQGYVHGDPNNLIIGVPQGLGAGGQDIIQWMGFLSDILALSTYSTGGIKRFWHYFRLRPIRNVAKEWADHGLLYPAQLRGFIDKKAEWKIEEVCKRLKINQEFGYKLLTALGLEPVGNTWRLTQSRSSIAKRKVWIRNERKYERLRIEQLEANN